MRLRIFDIDSWNEIWDTINRNRKRSIATAFGVFWGIFMLIILCGMGTGLSGTLYNNLGEMEVNSAFMRAGRTSIPYKGMASGRWYMFDNKDVEAIRALPGVKNVTGFPWSRQHTFSNGNQKGDYSICGLAPDYNIINPQIVPMGRFINDIDQAKGRKVCMIGKSVAEEMFPGESDPIGKTIRMNNIYFTVIGINGSGYRGFSVGDMNRMVIIPLSTFQQIFNTQDKINTILMSATMKTDMNILLEKAKMTLRQNHIISPEDEKAMYAYNLNDEFKMFVKLFSGLDLLIWIVGIGSLLAGIVGISNIMLVVVRERTQEIGVRRALGAKPSAIISQIMSESFVLTFIAGILGLASAVGILSIVESLISSSDNPIHPQVSLQIGLAALGVIMLGGLLAGLLPASRAMRIKPVDAIREE